MGLVTVAPKETCFVCRKETEYDSDTPLMFRKGYVEGGGAALREVLLEDKFRDAK